MRTRQLVICMECDREAYCVKLIEEVWPTQRVDQWVYWFNKPSSREKVPNIDWFIALLPGNKKNYGRPDPGVKS